MKSFKPSMPKIKKPKLTSFKIKLPRTPRISGMPQPLKFNKN